MKISDDIIRNITLAAINEVGDSATPELVKKIVNNAVSKLEDSSIGESISGKDEFKNDSGKVILTAFGINHSGIVAAITGILAESKCDIQDISQKILQNYFSMIMIVDITDSKLKFNDLREALLKIGEKLGIKIFIQHEDVFKFMHRI
jgi:ACT domain-containing protein